MALLKFAGMPRSTFYYYLKKMGKPDKYGEIKAVIKRYTMPIKVDMATEE